MSRTAEVPLRAEDALFLHAETPLLCQQVGAVLLLEPTAPDITELRAVVRERVHRVPGLRRRLAVAPGRWRRPFWVADEEIDFTERVRKVIVGENGAPRTIGGVIDVFFSQRCDPYRKPWDILLIHGAPGEGVAVAVKIHHALGDSHTIMRAMIQLFDGAADEAAVPLPARVPARKAPRGRARTAACALRGLGHLAAAGSAPDVSVCGPFTSDRRRFVAVEFPSRDVAMTARDLDAGIGDLLLTVIAEALSSLLRCRGEETAGRVVRVAIPRAQQPAHPHRAGSQARQNQTAAITLDVPVGPATPDQRMAAMRGQIATHVCRGEDVAAALVLRAMNILPPPLQRFVAARLYQRRWFNLLVSVFPGIRRSLRLLGARVEQVYPVVALADGVGLSIGAMTWDRSFSIGVLADAALVPDADKLAAELTGAFEVYQAAARAPRQTAHRAPVTAPFPR